MAGKAVKGTNDADGNGKKGGSLPLKPGRDAEEEARLAREHSENG